jgi:hypothetical protein
MIDRLSQCDEALLNKLKGLMLPNELGVITEVPVLYIDPEKELQLETKPAIVIYRAGVYPDNNRWTNDLFYDNLQYAENGDLVQVDERDAPDPYNVYYGIRLFYEYQEDGVELNNHIMKILRRGAYLNIGEYKYDMFFVSYRNPDVTYRDFGEIKENEQRTFVEQYLYRVETELDNATRITKRTSLELVVNTETKNP